MNKTINWRNIQDEQPTIGSEILAAVKINNNENIEFLIFNRIHPKEELDTFRKGGLKIYWVYTSEITPFN